jgi:hypothetical protein
MDKQKLSQIQAIRKYPSVSILLGLHTAVAESQQNNLVLKNLIKEAEDRLLQEFSKREVDKIIARLQAAQERLNNKLHYQPGLAIFINQDDEFIIDLPFDIKSRVIIDHTFATRDLIMGVARSIKYYVMTLSAKEVRLFRAYRHILSEIKEDGFPFQLTLEVEDTQRGFAQDKENQIKEFYNRLDKVFNQIYNQQPYGLVLVGAGKNLSYYKEIADNKRVIVSTIEGNHDHTNLHELGQITWNSVKDVLSRQRNAVLSELQAAVGAQKYVSGIEQVWRLAKEGRGRMLFAEEDYRVAGKIVNINENETLQIVDNLAEPAQ